MVRWPEAVKEYRFAKEDEQALKNLKLTEELIAQIKSALRQKASPRHVPALILQAPEFPRTKSNKLVEIAVANAVNKVANNNLGSLANPESLAWFSDLNL